MKDWGGNFEGGTQEFAFLTSSLDAANAADTGPRTAVRELLN